MGTETDWGDVGADNADDGSDEWIVWGGAEEWTVWAGELFALTTSKSFALFCGLFIIAIANAWLFPRDVLDVTYSGTGTSSVSSFLTLLITQ